VQIAPLSNRWRGPENGRSVLQKQGDTAVPLDALSTARAVLADSGPIDETFVRADRKRRVRERVESADIAALLVFDPVNLRYMTGTRNMQVWTMHNACRFALMAAGGPLILFELPTGMAMARAVGTCDEIRPALSADYAIVGPNADAIAARMAAEIAAVVREHGGGNTRLAVDRLDVPLAHALTNAGLTLVDGKGLLERARAVKSHEEIRALKASLRTCEAAMADMRAALQPGMTEQQALALLIKGSVERGGEYPETRLMTSGPRTNPWFQETGDRIMEAGDFLSFDTDLIGPMGFYNDISRTWRVGGGTPSDGQRRLYDLSRRQIDHNMALLRPGLGFLEFADTAFQLPDDCIENRYADVGHGCGLGVEYPFLMYREDAAAGAYDGVFEADMVICLESYVGATGGPEGVKLEQPVWITADGPVLLSDAPLEDDYA
jgi:Xaa-Pro dipeptidase